MSTRSQNEKKFGQWEELPGGGRRYRLDVTGRLGWVARYFKEVDANETTLRFWQEVYERVLKCGTAALGCDRELTVNHTAEGGCATY